MHAGTTSAQREGGSRLQGGGGARRGAGREAGMNTKVAKDRKARKAAGRERTEPEPPALTLPFVHCKFLMF